MDLEKARKLLADAEVVHDADAVQAALEVVAGKIRTQLADRNPLVLCVMTGGVIFCGQLLPKLDFPLDLITSTPPATGLKRRAARFPGAWRRGRRSRGVLCWWSMTSWMKA